MDGRKRRSMARNVRGTALVLAAVVTGLGASQRAGAGSVFMKNGYVLQGRVVKQTPEEVVLTWPNGTVTVATRFIESVALEPDDRVKSGNEAPAASEGKTEPAVTRTEIVLPADLDSLIQEIAERSRATTAPAPDPVAGRPGEGDPGSGATPELVREPGPETPVAVLPAEDQIPLREVGAGDGSVTLRIPEGWEFRELGDGEWQVIGPAVDGGKAPRISVVAVDALDGSIADQLAICRRAEGEFAGLEIARESRREIGLRLGFEAVGTIERDGARFGLRRILVPAGDRVYVIGCVSPMPADPVIEATLELCLGEIRFRS
ncbi:MAG: hypothetical protein JXP34_01470 [Planctomycetes bacterium]|nr:hypothetical protein [Planctomycetota bacterium]